MDCVEGTCKWPFASSRKQPHNRHMENRETIGQHIRRERLSRNLKQGDLAEMIGVGVPHVSKIEAGRENPSDELLERIAEVFEADFEEILLVARRLPEDLKDALAVEPRLSLDFLRSWADYGGIRPRRTFPRTDNHHALEATKVLTRHATTSGITIALPVPIELIVEQTYGLEILWDIVPDSGENRILGALDVQNRRIILNQRHQDLFEQYLGPRRFTLAHELAHWLYDAGRPEQLSLLPRDQREEIFCYHRDSPSLHDDLRIREINANKLAAHLLLPEDLVRNEWRDGTQDDLRETAARWDVSQTALRIRLQDLGLIAG